MVCQQSQILLYVLTEAESSMPGIVLIDSKLLNWCRSSGGLRSYRVIETAVKNIWPESYLGAARFTADIASACCKTLTETEEWIAPLSESQAANTYTTVRCAINAFLTRTNSCNLERERFDTRCAIN